MSQLLTLSISIILSAIVLILFIPIGYFVLQCLLALLPPKPEHQPPTLNRPSITVLIPAHNEHQVIGKTLTALLPQITELDQLLVIADNCTDNTAQIARQLGATVLERNDQQHRGKGYALAYGLNAIQQPSEVVVIIDADCLVQSNFLTPIAQEAIRTGRPVQAVYLMQTNNHSNPNPKTAISALAFKIKNLVRPQGLARLGLPCLLTGSGMAFPWSVIRHAPLASGNLVEDMQLGIDLALAGHSPRFYSQVQITGFLPTKEQAATSQKVRWIHGHLQTWQTQVPKLIREAMVQRRWELLALALDLFIPPLSLLMLVWLLGFIGSIGLGIGLHQWTMAIWSGSQGLLMLIAIIGAWAKFAYDEISLGHLLGLPVYLCWKILIYLAFVFKPQQQWVRTARKD